MKRSFFLTALLYLCLFGALYTLYKPVNISPPKRIALNSITFKKSCEYKECQCKNCQTHIKKSEHKKDLSLPKKEVKKQVKKEMKKVFKKEPKTIVKKIKKTKKVIQKPKVTQKRQKSIKKKQRAKKIVEKIQKKIVNPSFSQKSVSKNSAQASIKKQKLPSKSKSSPKPSYHALYVTNIASLIRQAIIENRYYPRVAKKRKKEGVVIVRFQLMPNKEIKDIKIVQSSGYSLLDRAAIKTIKRASRAFPKPKEPLLLKVPIEYRLK